MSWDWEKLRQSRNYNSRTGIHNFDYYNTVDNDNYIRKRRQAAIRNIIAITTLLALLIIGFTFMSISFEGSKTKTEKAITNFQEAVKKKKESSGVRSFTSTCIDGKKAVIVNDITYYAGTVDTWGDITTITCD